MAAKIATGELPHADTSLIRADVSWESLVVYVEPLQQVKGGPSAAEKAKKESRQTGRFKKVCLTDPDASMAANARDRRLEPA